MIAALSVNQSNASIAVREQYSRRLANLAESVPSLKSKYGGFVVLSTCNRFEIYASHVADLNDFRSAFAGALGIDGRFARRFDAFTADAAAEHLFRVACGLESAVLGEFEILGQVRSAYGGAVEAGSVDVTMSRLFHEALRVGRKAREQTAIGRLSLSISALAAQSAREHLGGSLEGHGALVIGAGEAGQLAARALADLGAAPITIANRNTARAEAVAEAVGGRWTGLADIPEELARADVVVTAVGGGSHLVTAKAVAASQAIREGTPAVYVDIGVPRDIEPDIAAVPGVTLLDLDDIQDAQLANRQSRAAEVARVESLISGYRADFTRWLESRAVVPSIAGLTKWADAVRARQLGRAFRGAGFSQDDQKTLLPVLDEFSRALVQQLLHPVIAAMRDPEDGLANAAAARALFPLPAESAPDQS